MLTWLTFAGLLALVIASPYLTARGADLIEYVEERLQAKRRS